MQKLFFVWWGNFHAVDIFLPFLTEHHINTDHSTISKIEQIYFVWSFILFSMNKKWISFFFYFLACTSTTILLDAMVQTLIFCLFVSLNTLCCLSLLYQVKSLNLESSKLASSILKLLISTLLPFYHLEMWHYQNLHQKRVYHHLWIKHQKCFNHFICNKPIRNKF